MTDESLLCIDGPLEGERRTWPAGTPAFREVVGGDRVWSNLENRWLHTPGTVYEYVRSEQGGHPVWRWRDESTPEGA